MPEHFPVFIILFVMCGACFVLAKQGRSDNANCSPTLSIESSEVPVRVGDDVIIKCRACGRKNIFWFKDGKRFGETKRVHWIFARRISSFPVVVEGKLRIENLRKKDRGVYTCYALDFLTNIMEKGDIRLVVKGRHHKTLAKTIKRK